MSFLSLELRNILQASNFESSLDPSRRSTVDGWGPSVQLLYYMLVFTPKFLQITDCILLSLACQILYRDNPGHSITKHMVNR